MDFFVVVFECYCLLLEIENFLNFGLIIMLIKGIISNKFFNFIMLFENIFC